MNVLILKAQMSLYEGFDIPVNTIIRSLVPVKLSLIRS